MQSQITIRLLKASMVVSVGLWALLIAFDNIIDYGSNWQFVQHVLSMSTVFPDNVLKYRAVTNPMMQTAIYWIIIATEWCSKNDTMIFAPNGWVA